MDTGHEQAIAERIELFFGRASDIQCHVYARLPNVDPGAGWKLSGQLLGPTCHYAHTLKATFQFVDRGPGDSLLAEAIVPEPSFWTPEMPHLYQAEVQVVEGARVVATAKRTFGIRPLGAAGNKLLLDARRWVLRGVRADELPSLDWAALHETDTALVVRAPNDELCAEASRLGVLLVAELNADEVAEIRRLSRWPAVGLISLPAEAALDADMPKHNLLLGQRVAEGNPLPRPWAQVLLCELPEDSSLDALAGSTELPRIAVRPAGSLASVVAGRAACDRLQRDLAGRGDRAGYIV